MLYRFPGVQFSIGFNDSGLCPDLQDGWLYEQYWYGKNVSNQIGHFLAAVKLGYDPSLAEIQRRLLLTPSNEPAEVTALRLIVGHEMLPDLRPNYSGVGGSGFGFAGVHSGYEIPGSLIAEIGSNLPGMRWPLDTTVRRQYQIVTQRELDLFKQAVVFDEQSAYEQRDQALVQILPSADPKKWQVGNSLPDLRLSVKGYRFGLLIRSGQLQTPQQAASWLRENLTISK